MPYLTFHATNLFEEKETKGNHGAGGYIVSLEEAHTCIYKYVYVYMVVAMVMIYRPN